MWVLIVFAYAGILSKGDSMALTTVPGFTTQTACIAAGTEAKKLDSGTVKEIRFACVLAK